MLKLLEITIGLDSGVIVEEVSLGEKAFEIPAKSVGQSYFWWKP